MEKEIEKLPRAGFPSASRFGFELSGVPDGASITTYVCAVWNRKWTMLGFVVLVMAVALLISFLTAPTYEGISQIAIYREDQGLLSVKQDARDSSEDSDYTVTLDTQAKIIEGDELASQVIRKLELDRNPDFAHRRGHAPIRADYKTTFERFHESLNVVKVPHTRLLQIRFFAFNPQLAAAIANELANAYIDYTFKVRYEATMKTSKRLAEELTDLRDATNDSEAKLIAYQQSHKIIAAEQLTATKLGDLSKDLTAVEVERIQKQTEYNLVNSNEPDRVGPVEPNSLLEHLRARESELSTEYAKVTSVMGPANPQVLELKNQLNEIHASTASELDRMKQRASNQYLAVVTRENWLRRALENQKRKATNENQEAIEYNNLKREADTSRQLYVGLLEKLKEAEVAAGLRASNVRIEQMATVPFKPSKPNIPFNLGMALFGSVIGGIVLAVVRDNLDSSVRNVQEAEALLGAPALATIPKAIELARTASKSNGFSKLASASGAGAILKSASPATESYRGLRSLVRLHFSERAPRVLLVTSCLAGEGKTTTAVNAAAAFAHNGRRVLLVDADLRNPSIHKAGVCDAPQEGLSTILAGHGRLEDVLMRLPGEESLFILPAGALPADPAELLGGERMEQLISQLKEQFSYIIIDSPPLLSGSDTLVLAPRADAVLLVVRESRTPKMALVRSRELLDKVRAPAVGIVINEVVESRASDFYYYGRANARLARSDSSS